MLLHNTPIFYSALVTIECETPLSVKGDESDLTVDSRIVRDVNGYPTIPGTSIAGVLRSVARECKAQANTLFGEASDGDNDLPSQIQVSFGFLHNANNQPIVGLLPAEQRTTENDVETLLKELMPILRDQVAINEYGAAKDSAKMDRTAVPKGTRFSFELNWAANERDDDQWYKILAWLYHPAFRLGGLTRRGFGKVKIVSIKQEMYNFEEQTELNRWLQNRQLDFNAQNGKDLAGQFQQGEIANYIGFAINLEAEDFWRIGQGNKALGQIGKDYDKEPDHKPYTETVIEWKNDHANTETQQVVIPASGIKGALRHRTLFHYRRLNNDFFEQGKDPKCADIDLKELLGTIEGGQAGSLILDDIYIPEKLPTKVIMHNKIDRFTGGTIDGALFSEQLLYGGGFQLKGLIKQSKQSAQLLKAFRLALLDLAQGRLALGGGSTKGHGYFLASDMNLTQLEQAESAVPNI